MTTATRGVELSQAPEAQALGQHAVLGGATAVDVAQVLALGLRVLEKRDGIAPNKRLRQALLALETAAARFRSARGPSDTSDTSDAADVRGEGTSEGSCIDHQVGTAKVAELAKTSRRQAQRLMVKLGGSRTHAGHLRIDRRVLEIHLAEQEQAHDPVR